VFLKRISLYEEKKLKKLKGIKIKKRKTENKKLKRKTE